MAIKRRGQFNVEQAIEFMVGIFILGILLGAVYPDALREFVSGINTIVNDPNLSNVQGVGLLKILPFFVVLGLFYLVYKIFK